MTATALKKELHKAIDIIEDESFLKAVYTIMNEKIYDYDLTSEQWTEIEKRRKLYKSGKSQTYTWEEAKKMLRADLKK